MCEEIAQKKEKSETYQTTPNAPYPIGRSG